MNDKDWLMALVSRMYYIEEQNQEEIARKLSFSRASISRLLREARDEGIVEIKINFPWQQSADLEKALRERFGLKDARVLASRSQPPELILEGMGVLCARYLLEALKPSQTLSIAIGTSIHHTVLAMPVHKDMRVNVVQMMGVVGTTSPQIDGAEMARLMADHLGGSYYYIHAPLLVENPAVREGLLQTLPIHNVLEMAAKSQVALVGAESALPVNSSLLRIGMVSRAYLEELVQLGAVGLICGKAYNARGEPIHIRPSDQIISIGLEDLRKVPLVIGVAGGSSKREALLGALRGGYLNVLVTDSDTAELLLK